MWARTGALLATDDPAVSRATRRDERGRPWEPGAVMATPAWHLAGDIASLRRDRAIARGRRHSGVTRHRGLSSINLSAPASTVWSVPEWIASPQPPAKPV